MRRVKEEPDKGEMRAKYEAGASIRALAAEYDVSYGTAHSRLKDAGAKIRARGGEASWSTRRARAVDGQA